MWGALSGEIFVTDWSRRVVHRFDGSSWQLDTLATNSRLSGVWGSSASDVYVAGERGLIAHYDGTRWTTSTIDSMLYIAKAWRVGSGPLRVLMGPGRIYEFNGALAPLGPEVDLRVLDLWPQGPHAFVAAGYLGDGSSGVAYRFDGSAWSEIARTPNDLRSAWSSATGDVYVAGKGVWRHQDGETEKVLGAKGPSGTIYDFWRAPTGEIIAVGSRAYRYDERGWTDLEMGSLSGNTTFAVHGRSADDFYAVGNQTVLHYRKGTWDWVGTGFQSNLRGVSVDGSDVTVVGWDTGGTISRFDGTQWTRMESNTSRRLYDIWGWADGAIAVGEEGTILRFDGVEWRPETSPVTFNLRQVLGFGPNRIIATGDSSSEIVLYDGRVWKAVTTTMTGDATAWNTSLWGTSLNDLFIAQDEGLVYHFDGKAWSLLSPLLMHRANAIVGLPDGDVLVTGDETVLRYHPRSAR
jgi:hypothetical protein